MKKVMEGFKNETDAQTWIDQQEKPRIGQYVIIRYFEYEVYLMN